jgi:tetratricopeptide (TPR) repeat protein
MKNNQEGQNQVDVLIFQYEELSQKNTVPFFEKTAFWQIAVHYVDCLMLTKARVAIEHALTFYAQTPEFHIFGAEVALMQQDMDGSCTFLAKAQELICDESHHVIYRIEAQIKLGQHENALASLSEFKHDCGYYAQHDKPLVFPEYLRNFRKTEVMFNYLLELLKAQPQNEFALKQLYFCMEVTGAYEEVIPVLLEVLDAEPHMSAAWYNLGIAYQQTNNLERAYDAFEYAIISDSSAIEPHYEFACVAFELGKYQTALETWKYVCINFELLPEYLVQMGDCYEQLNQADIALDLYQKAIELDGNCSVGHYHLGRIHHKNRELEQALQSFQIARQLDPSNEKIDLSLAAIQLEMGNSRKALRALQSAFELNPENPDCAIAYIMLLLDLGRDRAAYKASAEAMKYHNGVAVLTALRGVCVIRIGKKREGFNWISIAAEEGLADTDMVYRFLKDEN